MGGLRVGLGRGIMRSGRGGEGMLLWLAEWIQM